MRFIDCSSVRDEILTEVKEKVEKIEKTLKLVIFQIGNDDASAVYVKNKRKTADEVGIKCDVVKCSENILIQDLKYLIRAYGNMKDVTGMMLQLPLPEHLSEYKQELLDMIPWQKDVDGLSSESVGRLWNGLECITPATPTGVMRLLSDNLSGQTVCIVNRSNLIGKPLTKLLLDRNATVTVCHSKSDKAYSLVLIAEADIVVTGIGKPRYFDKKYFSATQTWIDCGINRDAEGHLCGDVDTDTLEKYNVSVTPVPRGVGIITTAQLMANVVKAYELQKKR